MSLKRVELKPKIATIKTDLNPQPTKESPDEVVITVNDLPQPTINKTIITVTKQPATSSFTSAPTRILIPEKSIEENDHDDEEEIDDEDLENYEYDEEDEEK